MDWLPGATKQNWNRDGGTWTDTKDPKGVLHTTETGSWPSYGSGASAPHLTVKPIPGVGVEVRQHSPLSKAARALRNPAGGVQTNRDYAFQVELIGSCDISFAKRYGYYYWPQADDAVLLDLFRKVIEPLSKEFGIPLTAPTFQSYPGSYGARGKTNTVRLSGPEFDRYTGWLGHQHVPENTHGDPGDFPWDRMIALGTGVAEPEVSVTTPKRTPASRKPKVDLLKKGDKGEAVEELVRQLIDLGYGDDLSVNSDVFGPKTEAAVKALQRRAGIMQDGIVGPDTRKALADKTLAQGADRSETKRTQQAVRVKDDGLWGNDTDRAVSAVREGTKGRFSNGVRYLQQRVGTKVDGAWGPNSRSALKETVRSLQRAWGATPDGVWGPNTDKAYHAARARNYKKW